MTDPSEHHDASRVQAGKELGRLGGFGPSPSTCSISRSALSVCFLNWDAGPELGPLCSTVSTSRVTLKSVACTLESSLVNGW